MRRIVLITKQCLRGTPGPWLRQRHLCTLMMGCWANWPIWVSPQTKVTLHVGAGTFLPVKTDDVSEHKMHAEWGRVSEEAAAQIAQTKRDGWDV